MTWTVTGTTKPVYLKLENPNSATGELAGGNVQTVVTSGGSRNKVSRKVTGLQPGAFGIIVTFAKSENPKQIASAFRKAMKRLAAETTRGAKRLHVRSERSPARLTVSLEEVLALLDHIEAELTNELPYLEMAPFRDAAAELLDEVRSEVKAAKLSQHNRSNGILLAANRVPGTPLEAPRARTWLDRVAEFFRDKINREPLDTICIVTIPDSGANVLVYPRSLPADRHTTTSSGRLSLYLGRYVYEIRRNGYLPGTGEVNLLLSPERVLECPLARIAGDSSACRPLGEPVEKRCR